MPNLAYSTWTLVVEVEGAPRVRQALPLGAFTLGRDPASCDVLVEHPSVSRRHCVWEPMTDGEWVVRDLGSANGTWLNGDLVNEVLVRAGMRIFVGEVQLTVESPENPDDRMPLSPLTPGSPLTILRSIPPSRPEPIAIFGGALTSELAARVGGPSSPTSPSSHDTADSTVDPEFRRLPPLIESDPVKRLAEVSVRAARLTQARSSRQLDSLVLEFLNQVFPHADNLAFLLAHPVQRPTAPGDAPGPAPTAAGATGSTNGGGAPTPAGPAGTASAAAGGPAPATATASAGAGLPPSPTSKFPGAPTPASGSRHGAAPTGGSGSAQAAPQAAYVPPIPDITPLEDSESRLRFETVAQHFTVAPAGGIAAPSRSVLRAVVRSRRAVHAVDVQSDYRFSNSESVRMRNLRSVLCTPLMNDEEIIGALYVESVRHPLSLSENDLEVLRVMGSHVVTSLENRKLFERIERAAERLQVEAQSARKDRAALTISVRQSEKKFRAAFEDPALGTAFVNSRTSIIEEVNEGMAQLTGRSRRELVGRPFRELFPSPETTAIGEWLRLVATRGGMSAETRLLHSSGQLLSVHHAARAVDIGAEVLILSRFVNITGQKRAEQQVRNQMRRIGSLQEVSQALMSTLDPQRLLMRVYDKVRSVLPVDAFVIALTTRGGAALKPVVAVDLIDGQPQSVNVRDEWPTSAPLFSRLVSRREPIKILRNPGEHVDLEIPGIGRSGFTASMLHVPMIAGDAVLGIVSAQSYTSGAYDDSHLEYLLSVAALTASAIQNARLFESTRRQREDLQHLSNQLLQAQENERGRIARELHDGIGQVLTGLKLHLQQLHRAAATDLPPEVIQKRIGDAAALAASAIQDLRSISLDLRPSMLDDLGLVPTLDWLCREVAGRHDIDVHFSPDIGDARYPKEVETPIYRIVQEGLGNIVKHAKAQHARVELAERGDMLQLSIADDGQGFDPQDLPRFQADRQSSGILNMKERASMLGGSFRLTSQAGEGTVLAFEIPLKVRNRTWQKPSQ